MYFFLCARECPDEKPSTSFINSHLKNGDKPVLGVECEALATDLTVPMVPKLGRRLPPFGQG